MDANKALQAKVRYLKDKIKDKKRKYSEKTEKLYDRIDQLIEQKAALDVEKRKHSEELYDRIDQLKAALEDEVARAKKQARCAEDAARAIKIQKTELQDRLINDMRRKVDDLSVECKRLRAENAEHTAFRRDLGRAIEETLIREQKALRPRNNGR
jgi:hypothetical protein